MERLGLRDLGSEEKKYMWHRPGKGRNKSRIDYMLVSESFQTNQQETIRMNLDHAFLLLNIKNDRNVVQMKLKDWVLQAEEFKEAGRTIIWQTIQAHEIKEGIDNMRYSTLREYDNRVNVIDKAEGTTTAHVLQVILTRVVALQRRIQSRKIRERKERMERYTKQMYEMYVPVKLCAYF
jgi:hypothetical protein